MVTKAQQRINKAKRQYQIAEEHTDSWILRLVDSKWTLAIVVAALVGVLVLWAR